MSPGTTECAIALIQVQKASVSAVKELKVTVNTSYFSCCKSCTNELILGYETRLSDAI